MTSHNEMLEAAIYYANLGFRVLPVRPRNKIPLISGWPEKATTDAATITKWWTATPNANIGIATGKNSNLFVLDIDGPKGAESMTGRPVPDGAGIARTGRGWHVYTAFPSALDGFSTSKSGVLPGIDVRGSGGFVVAPPSIHETGVEYEWIDPPPCALPAPPDWLVREVAAPNSSLIPKNQTKRSELPQGEVRFISWNYDIDPHPYAEAALKGECQAVLEAPIGTRNNKLNIAAFKLGTLVGADTIDPFRITTHLLNAACSNGLSSQEAHRTIESGLRAGMACPRRRDFV